MTSASRKETILVAGGAGFLGQHLCRHLLNNGAIVVCLDDFSTSSPHSLIEMRENKNFSIIEHDITEPITIEIDRIYNLACAASPTQYHRLPLKTARTNTVGVLNLLEVARECEAPFFQASTSEVYGDPAVHPQTEDYFGNVNPVGLRAPYTEGKRAAEMLVMSYHRKFGVPVRIARIFNTYGPGMAEDDGRAVSTFVRQALQNDEITIHGTGRQTRSFCYVDDMIRGLTAMMNRAETIVGPMNLGNPEEVTVLELANIIRDTIGSSSQIVHRDNTPDDPVRRCPDISLALNMLSWEPQVALQEGIRRTIESIRYEKPFARSNR